MPAALSMNERWQLVALREQGETFRLIAETLDRDYEAVRRIYQRYLRTGQLEPRYDQCRQTAIRKDEAIYQRAIEIKQVHPRWGAGLIWIELAEEFDEEKLPSQRTLQRWFRRAGVQKPPPERRPKVNLRRGKQAHEVWALDAKERIELADGSYVSWLTVTDEGSGAILGTALFPHPTLDDHQPSAGQSCSTRPDELLGASEADAYG